MVLIMAVVNLASMLFFLVSPLFERKDIIAIFSESLIIVLNMIIGRYIYLLRYKTAKSFESRIKHLFLVGFVSVCVLLFVIFYFDAQNNFLIKDSEGFWPVYLLILLLMFWGTVIPGILSILKINKNDSYKNRLNWLLVINMLNNLIGLLLYKLGVFDSDIGLLANMAINLVFAYYYGIFMLSYFFTTARILPEHNKSNTSEYSWQQLSTHLHHWSETRLYLKEFEPEIVEQVDKLPLSDLEKIHLTLKRLNIKGKDVANALNVSLRAVDMQRYRINKKLGGK